MFKNGESIWVKLIDLVGFLLTTLRNLFSKNSKKNRNDVEEVEILERLKDYIN